MKAIIYEKYGFAKRVKYLDVEKPLLEEDKILVKIHAASINKLDEHVLRGRPIFLRIITGIFKPKWKILGSDFSGVIEEVGKNITGFLVGDEVFGQLGMKQEGSFAEYALLSPKQLTHKPKNVSHKEAASIPIAGLTALQALRAAGVNENTNLLIYGASGGVGTFMIQIAKSIGSKVTAVCSTRNIEVAKKSKADLIIDYKKEVWDKDDIQYDVIIGVNGYNSMKRYRDALKKNGVCLVLGGDIKDLLKTNISQLFTRKKGRRFLGLLAQIKKSDLDILAELLEKQKIHPYIDKEFLLKNTEDALNHFINGKTIGKTIITINDC